MITKNAIRCNKCGDIIESKHRHDFKWCKCGKVAVDGGKAYLRRVGENWTDLSTEELTVRQRFFEGIFVCVYCSYYYWDGPSDKPVCVKGHGIRSGANVIECNDYEMEQ